MAVNARSMLCTMQAVAPRMIAAGGGSIVNLASMAAETGGENEGAYAASKAAVLALTRAAALEWGRHGIRVNAVCPGYVPTEMGAATRTEADVAAWCSRSPLGRLGTPADVAAAVTFLASADAAYLTGQVIDVSGGMMLH
jgi:3-oxoacyl-[acyl-carrier protein] reductase